ncbi:MAG: hypothetical protein KC912_00800 [Proteobacteria bacterium]|nr:hypothetical protein [Pseudomonadota bacterium]
MLHFPSAGRLLAVSLVGGSLLANAEVAEAFPTRVHIALANEVRTELLASPDGRSIRLEGSDAVLKLTEDDARAVRDWPLAFRAGAVGPDNFVFPAMTDLTHAIGLYPYDQCEDLYQAAVTDQERAYAMGCFLHGSSDAVAHHYVNWLSGETFTLNPASDGRETGWSNVVRHMVAESMIQEGWREADPEAFHTAGMLHAIPADFVLDTVMNPDSPVWQKMATHAAPQWEAIEAGNPDASLFERVSALDVAPAEYLVLLPLIVEESHLELDMVLLDFRDRVLELQDHSSADGSDLLVTAGDDGVLSTSDDETDCATTCPTLYMEYSVLVSLLEPQADLGGASAAEVILTELHGDIDALLPAYVETVALTSAMLNSGLEPGQSALDVQELDPSLVMGPLDAWAEDLTAIDWDLLARTVLPGWLVDLEAWLDSLGINLNLGAVLQSFIQPILDDLVDSVLSLAMAEVQTAIEGLTAEYAATAAGTEVEFSTRLDLASPSDINGTVLDHWLSSGVYTHSFNAVAATLADHRMMLPISAEHGGIGPASFDASYTLAWSQAAVCPHLAPHVFPAGPGLGGLLAIYDVDAFAKPSITEEPPVECHDGAADVFTNAPELSNCGLTGLDALMSTPVGSLSRSWPPELYGSVDCLGVELEGLPPIDDGGDDTADPADTGGADTGTPIADDVGEGCGGCASGGVPAGSWLLLVLLAGACTRRGAEDTDTGVSTDTSDETTDTADSDTSTDSQDSTPWKSGPGWALVADIGDSSWNGPQSSSADGKQRHFQFDAGHQLIGEIVNPWGPGRSRQLRAFVPNATGTALDTTVQTPAGWPISSEEGTQSSWPTSVAEASPRQLHVDRGTGTEVYLEGPLTPPSGFTAIARSFVSDGDVDEAFCNSGTGGFDHLTLFAFARGERNDELLAEEVVAGARIESWSSGSLAMQNLNGFDRNGGTTARASTNWLVRYVGTIDHPGGTFSLRERNDSVEDGVWAWVGSGVGGSTNNWFLEVHGFFWADGTDDEPSRSFPAGPLDIEVLLVRCDQTLEDVSLEYSINGGSWTNAAQLQATPELPEEWFPEAL